MAPDTEHGGFKIEAPARGGGVRKNTTIDFEFMDSPEFTDLAAIYADLAVLGPPPYVLQAGSDAEPSSSSGSRTWPNESTSSARRACRSSATRVWAR